MDPFDDIFSERGVTSRAGVRFQPKIKPRPKKQTLAPQLSAKSEDIKGTILDAKSCADDKGNTKLIKSSSQLPVTEEKKEYEDGLLLGTARSDFIGCSLPTSVESDKVVDTTLFSLDSCGSLLPSGSTIDDGVTDAIDLTTSSSDPVGVKNLTDDTKNSELLTYSHPSAPSAHEATVVDQGGLGSIQSEDGHFIDGKIAGQNIDLFYELECLDDFHNQPKNEADPSSLKQATISNEGGDLDKQRLEIEECGAVANVTMDTLSSVTTTPSERPACKYIPKPKMRTAGDACTQISQPEISNMLPPSPQVISCDTSGMNEASIGMHSDGVLNDSSINFDGYAPVNQDTETPVNVESFAFDSYGDILVDDFNSDDQDEMLREENGKNDEEEPSTESNISQQQKNCPPVGEEIEHSKTSRKLRKKVSHQLDEPEDGVDDNRKFPNEPSSNSDMHGDGYNKKETPRGGQGKKTSTKSSKPSSENEKPTRKRKDANKAVPDSQTEKRPKKFSHSTRRNRRQVNKVLLETPEDDIDFQKISFRDLIIYHEHKEKLEKKVASTRKSETNQRTDASGEEIYNDGEENLASEQGKGTDDDETPDVVDMTSAYFNYQSFMDKTPRTKWSKSDTERFYEAVRQFGTDFCMIQQLFPGKTRRQIKLKFKNEERHHPFRLSDAITNRAKDHSQFLSLIEQLKEAAKAKHESNQDELTENTGDEERPELSPETNEEEVEQPEGGVEETEKEEFVGGEVHSPLKGEGSGGDDDDDDPNRWDEYKFDY